MQFCLCYLNRKNPLSKWAAFNLNGEMTRCSCFLCSYSIFLWCVSKQIFDLLRAAEKRQREYNGTEKRPHLDVLFSKCTAQSSYFAYNNLILLVIIVPIKRVLNMFCIDNCSQLIKWALRNHQKWLSVLSAIGVLYILARFLGIYQFHVYRTGLINSGKQCYFREILPNADPNFYFLDVMPKGQLYGDSPAIFFHETSCANNLTANLTPR